MVATGMWQCHVYRKKRDGKAFAALQQAKALV